MGYKRKNISVDKAAGGAVLFGGIGLATGFLGKRRKRLNFIVTIAEKSLSDN